MENTTKRWIFDITAWSVAVLAGTALIVHDAVAGGGRLTVPVNERWKTECGSCHIAYPPQLLPAESWGRVMSGLDRHFGTDASIDPAAGAEIAAFLERHAGSGRGARGPGDSLRITETAWFVHEHDELSPAVWKRAAVKSAANCAACHAGAEQGDFRERNIRIPR
jgi:diheme cytochrome c